MVEPTYALVPEPNEPPSQLKIPNVAGSLSPEVTVANDRFRCADVMDGMRSRTHPATIHLISTLFGYLATQCMNLDTPKRADWPNSPSRTIVIGEMIPQRDFDMM